jgi:hypothetical protein
MIDLRTQERNKLKVSLLSTIVIRGLRALILGLRQSLTLFMILLNSTS